MQPTTTEKPQMDSPEWIRELVSYHAPSEEEIVAISNIRAATQKLIETIIASAPRCADRSAAIRKAREAMMTANAAIVLRGLV